MPDIREYKTRIIRELIIPGEDIKAAADMIKAEAKKEHLDFAKLKKAAMAERAHMIEKEKEEALTMIEYLEA